MAENRARKRAIRERMARTGEPYTLAARRHDEEFAASRAEGASDDQEASGDAR